MDFTSTDHLVASRVLEAMQKTPPGRVLAVVFDLPLHWGSSYPWESEISKVILGNPSERTTDPEWQILATIAARCCSIRPRTRSIKREMGIALFVKCGDRAYSRRLAVSPSVLKSSRLDSLHPVFTRDVANNVWHLASANAFSEIRKRLIGLLTWSDEETLVFRGNKISREVHRPLDLTNAAIGIPTKVDYMW